MLISFVIPCYRSETTIEKVIAEIAVTMALREDNDFEIICVNDCSPDKVYEVLTRISSKNPKVKIINFSRNFGKAAAVLAGYARCRGEVVVSLDDDGQCPVDKTWELVDALNDNCDLSIADYPQKKESAFKRFGSAVNSSVMNFLIKQPENITINNFWAMKRFVAEEMIKYKNSYPALHPLLVQTTHSIIMVPMEERNRADNNKTGFTFWKSFKLMINGFTNFSVVPLRLASVMGLMIAIVGFIYGLIVIIRKIVNPDILIGYSSLMAVLLFIGGIIMILLGVIGEYLGRIYVCINKAPQYVVKDTINLYDNEEG